VVLLSLSAIEVGAMAAHLTGARVDSSRAERLWEITEGYPLFVREVVRSAFQPSEVVHGVWAWRSPLPPDGQSIDTVSANIGLVAKPVREVLTALAVGQPLPLAMITALVPAEAVAEAEGAVLVTVDGHEDVRLAHPLYREVCWRSLHERISSGDAHGLPTRPSPPSIPMEAIFLENRCGLAAGAWNCGRTKPGLRPRHGHA